MATNISGIGIANAIGFNKFKMGGIASLKPIASYRCYDKTNDDVDRDILTDLTGNGHDIQLYNFAFSGGSGYGKYGTNFNSFNYNRQDRWEANVTSNLITVTKVLSRNLAQLYYRTSSQINIVVPSYKIEVTGLTNGQRIRYINTIEGEQIDVLVIENDGIYTIPSITYIGNSGIYGFCIVNIQESCNITIEQIPEYKGALVSDGVDDCGLCENFPTLTKEKGYTVVAIRKWLDYSNDAFAKVFLSKRVYDSSIDNPVQWGAFTLDKVSNISGIYSVVNYGVSNNTNDLKFITNTFTYLTSGKWNNTNINIGNFIDNYSYLILFTGFITVTSNVPGSEYSSIALYALEIYDRDLTDEEIAKVKARMIAEYEEKTGNKYEEETA